MADARPAGVVFDHGADRSLQGLTPSIPGAVGRHRTARHTRLGADRSGHRGIAIRAVPAATEAHRREDEMMALESLLERNVLPDALLRFGIRRLLRSRLREERRGSAEAQKAALQELIAQLRASPIAIETDAANAQHYEVPTRFFQLCLGPRLKYSSALWLAGGVDTLDAAEEAMLQLTCERAGIADGQRILELGCGWGSLSLWLAEHYPNARITGVSNSSTQRHHIESQC